MVCTSYTAGAAPVADVTAPVTSVTVTKNYNDLTVEMVKVVVTCGAGSGTQPDLNVTIGTKSYTGFKRIINGSTTFETWVAYGNTVSFCVT